MWYWYIISILTFLFLLWLFTIIGPGGQNNLIASNFFQGSRWFSAWIWFLVYVVITVVVAAVSMFTKIHIMPEPIKPYHMLGGFYWWSYTIGIFLFILVWRLRGGSFLQRGGPFRTNFRRFFVTYAILSIICVPLVVTSIKIAGIAVLGLRWGSEQVEEVVDQQIETMKEKAESDSTFVFRSYQ